MVIVAEAMAVHALLLIWTSGDVGEEDADDSSWLSMRKQDGGMAAMAFPSLQPLDDRILGGEGYIYKDG